MRFLHSKLIIGIFLSAVFILITAGDSFAVPASVKGHHIITDFYEVISLLVVGIFVGVIGTLIGAGGGFLHVPMLIIFFGFSPQHAIGTSIAIVFLNALSGTFSYIAQKRIDYELGLKFSVVAVPGVIIGALLAQKFNITVFSFLFGILLAFMAYVLIFMKEFHIVRENSMELPATKILQDSTGHVHTYAPDLSVGLGGSFFIGIISGLFGIGGGIVHVPLMNFIGIPVHISTATSHFIITITSFFGSLIFYGLAQIDMDYAVFLGIGTIIGAVYGAKLALITPSATIKKVIGSILVLVSLKLIF